MTTGVSLEAESSMVSSSSNLSTGPPQVSESLAGLMKAFDALKTDVGYGGWDEDKLGAFEKHLAEVESENIRLREDAEDIILVAQQLREENEELQRLNEDLQSELANANTSEMMKEAGELAAVAYEFDKELMNSKLAEAEAAVLQLAEVRNRMSELEENNLALTEMLNESRQSFQQLQRLQRTVVVESADTVTSCASEEEMEERAQDPSIAAEDSTTRDDRAMERPDFINNKSAPSGDGLDASLEDPLEVAHALQSIVGSTEVGVVAVAVRMLKEYSIQKEDLRMEISAKEAMIKELDELNDIVNAKTFKAPSAWAEREVKYKQDKRQWEEQVRGLQSELEDVKSELETLRSSTGARSLEKRIEDLELQLVESEKQKNSLQAALHEMTIASRSGAGEYSITGIVPYIVPSQNEGSVQNLVEKIEVESSSTTIQSRQEESVTSGVHSSQIDSHAVSSSVQDSVQGMWRRDNSVVKNETISSSNQVRYLRKQIEKVKEDCEALRGEFASLEQVSEDSHAPTLDLESILKISEEEAKTKLSLIKYGIDVESSRKLSLLETQRQINLERQKNCTGDDIETLQNEYHIIENEMRLMARAALPLKSFGDINNDKEAFPIPHPILEVLQDSENGERTVLGDIEEEARAKAAVTDLESKIHLFEQALVAKSNRKKNIEEVIEIKEAELIELEKMMKTIAADEQHVNLSNETHEETKLKMVSDKVIVAPTAKEVDFTGKEPVSSDIGELQRSNMALETQIQLLELKLAKSQESLVLAKQERGIMEESVDRVIESGDISLLSQIREQSQKRPSSTILSRRLKLPFKKRGNASSTKFGLKHGSKESRSDEKSSTGIGFDTETIDKATSNQANGIQDINIESNEELSHVNEGGSEDFASDVMDSLENLEVEMDSIREENKMLMEYLVNTKVRLAEVEGDYLEARRALLRAREAQVKLTQRIQGDNDASDTNDPSEEGPLAQGSHYITSKRLHFSER